MHLSGLKKMMRMMVVLILALAQCETNSDSYDADEERFMTGARALEDHTGAPEERFTTGARASEDHTGAPEERSTAGHARYLQRNTNLALKTLSAPCVLAHLSPEFPDGLAGQDIHRNNKEINKTFTLFLKYNSLKYFQLTHAVKKRKQNVFTALETSVKTGETPELSLNDVEEDKSEVQLKKVSEDVQVIVNARETAGHLQHFWRSTGLCPPSPHTSARPFLLSQDETLNLALIGTLPHGAVAQVRVHWLLDLVQGSLENGFPRYDFSQLDSLLDHLHNYHLRPGLELMGNPGNLFTDMENHTQVIWWRDLVAHTARRYIGRYGLEWVSSWLWETWNEPDHHDFDNLNFTLQGFLNYFDACSAGLKEVSESLVLGGPGGSCHPPNFFTFCWAILQHCHNGSSYFTPGKPPTIDFISFHKKGSSEADSILDQELDTINTITTNYPSLRHLPMVNDEADFLKGWWRVLEWRADARYAALVVRSVYIHQLAQATHTHQLAQTTLPHINLISFDNAFLNYRPSFFEQRTMMARFQINCTTPRQVQLVKKPAYTIMGLLSLLGDHYLTTILRGLSHPRLSVISSCRRCQLPSIQTTTRIKGTPERHTWKNVNRNGEVKRKSEEANGRWEATVVLSLSNGSESSTRETLTARVSLALPRHLLGEELFVVSYQLGLGQLGPYQAWLDLGRPQEPTRHQLAYMRSFEGADRSGPHKVLVTRPNLSWWVRLTLPDVRVIHVCQRLTVTPGQVVGVRTLSVTSADVLLTWSDARLNTRCVLKYEVERSLAGRAGPYIGLYHHQVTDNNFWYSLPVLHGSRTVQGWYRVRVVTYWGTKGPFSPPVYHHVG
ncbi:alpha-L-iduronidase isoform X1 [Cherax quadricarinatus]